MKFNKFEVITTSQVEELLAYNLNMLGIDGVEVVDNHDISDEDKKRMFIDISPTFEEGDKAVLRFFVEADKDIEDIKKIVLDEINRLEEFFDVGDKTIYVSEVDDEDWKDRWKEFFKPFYIDDIYITPTWIDDKKDEKLSIKIDPGSAFGTGLHETTRLCMKAIRKYVKEDDIVLDMGCGSAILSILCDKLGAKEIVAVDIDPNAVDVAKENLDINEVNENKYQLYCGNIIEDKTLDASLGYDKYDVIVANLLAEIVVDMSKYFLPHLKKGGILITSGILEEKEEKVKLALKKNGFDKFEVVHDGEWISVIAKR